LVTGAENIPASGPAILASNHLSIIDSIYLPLMVSRPVTFAAKSEYFTGTRPMDRLIAAYLRATKQLSTDRAGAPAAQDMLDAAAAARGVAGRHLPGGHPVAGRPVVPRPDGRRLAGAELGRSGDPGGDDRHREGAAARPQDPPAGQDRDQDRRAADVRGAARGGDRGPAAPCGHRRGGPGHPEAVRAGVRADVRVGAQGGTSRGARRRLTGPQAKRARPHSSPMAGNVSVEAAGSQVNSPVPV